MSYTTPVIKASTLLTAKLFNYIETQYDEMVDIYDNSNHNERYYTITEVNNKFYKIIEGAVTDADADMLDGHHVTDLLGDAFPVGSILWWYGAYEDIPNGWHVCDGTNGTFNLLDRMIIGKGSTYNVLGALHGALTKTLSGGTITVNSHTITSAEFPFHSHTFTETHNESSGSTADPVTYNTQIYDDNTYQNESETDNAGSGGGHNHTGNSITFNAMNILPSCRALYIIKRIG